MKDLKVLLKDWFGQEELLGRILEKLGSEKTSEVLEQIAEEEGIKETLIFNRKENEN
jgi:hypothetical protein